MALDERLTRYRALEDYRGRPLIVYATSSRERVAGDMAADAVREFIDQLDALEDGADSVDVLIHSTGGDALVAWKLMSLIREQVGTVGVLVPNMAFSAATIFALGADEIVMHPHASLGPTDPQIIIDDGGRRRRFSFEDVGAFLRFLSEEVEISEQEHISSIVKHLFEVADPVAVGRANRASELSTAVGERLLRTHMTGAGEEDRAKTIATNLNKSFFAHRDAVSRTRARSLNLQIADDDPALERLLWEAYLGVESYMRLREPFDPLQHYLQNGGREDLEGRSPLALPPNAPEKAAKAAWQEAIEQALEEMSGDPVEVGYHHVNAIVESRRHVSRKESRGVLVGARMPGGEINLTSTTVDSGWVRESSPPGSAGGAGDRGEAESDGAPGGPSDDEAGGR